ncbi:MULTISPECIES: DNA-3-methyladenine glycosylase 2 family protein [Pseudomonadati]|uniref:Helix-turn-helix domain-containing protein n=1 Tax=Shewanella aestuarii TaxID=1028752 RepID=A0ABT0L1R7_9GAMM|nr:AlkA N-terminal domain-containing protein [Shewanella aestuarii]MCL1117672.1 helix-turn-helix domain-containing protein [Shewanella aestuarii]GGN76413.1 alcohol dehydrogenase [Shewanella aestuarii]
MARLPEHDCALLADVCRQARLSRDARFDGQFFTGVFTTGIYCRSICPASPPHEKNVRYFDTSIKAANHGLRPCLRCRPDSAPHSYAWMGTKTTLQRAVKLIDAGAMAGDNALSVEQLSEKLGISSRYLVKLFNQYLGTSPKRYAIYQQVMFAKKLLHQTSMPITEVAFAAGFNSVRSFNDAFKQALLLTPSALRKSVNTQQNDSGSARQFAAGSVNLPITLTLSYRPPLNWQAMYDFYHLRQVSQMEWIRDHSYGRSFDLDGVQGIFELKHIDSKAQFELSVIFVRPTDSRYLANVVNAVRKLLDLDADMATIELQLQQVKVPLLNNTQRQNLLSDSSIKTGLRIPATFSVFEAACRAVLGQQVSVVQATKLLNTLVAHYGELMVVNQQAYRLFPTPKAIASASLDELKMPGARKLALNALGQFVADNPQSVPVDWLNVKGIGPWTVAYAQMRGQSDPNIFLSGDLVIKNRLKVFCLQCGVTLDTAKQYGELVDDIALQIAPWGSYLTFQLWANT